MFKKLLCIWIAVILFCVVPTAARADEPIETTLPARYLTECPEQGTVSTHFYKGKEQIKVWTPYDYSEHKLYEIVLLMHGGGGSMHSWLTKERELFGHILEGRYVFDWMAYEKVTVPFIVVTLNNKPDDPETMVRDIRDALLYVATTYSVYPDANTDSLILNREHITVGGLSRGSILTHWFLSITPEYAGNYICMSAAGPYTEIPQALENKHVRMLKLFSAVGVIDGGYYDMTKTSYEFLKPYADESMYLEYRYGHTWEVWLSGVYEALRFLLPEYSTEYELRCSMLLYLQLKTVPLPCLFGRRIRNR